MTSSRAADVLRSATASGYAVPAINVVNMETIQAAIAAAEAASAPIILQISSGAIAFAGYHTLSTLAFGEAERAGVPVVVHLDHCRDATLVRQALADGFPSVMFDGSQLTADENLRQTAMLAEEAHRHGAILEGELGVIGGSEAMTLEEAQASRSSANAARAFADRTSVDILAPALGNLHRMPDDSVRLDIEHVRAVAAAAGVPLALHGGSGVQRTQLGELVRAGVAKVNISSRVGRAFARGIQDTWASRPQQFDIRAYLGQGRAALQEMITEYLDLCCASGAATTTESSTAWSHAMVEAE